MKIIDSSLSRLLLALPVVSALAACDGSKNETSASKAETSPNAATDGSTAAKTPSSAKSASAANSKTAATPASGLVSASEANAARATVAAAPTVATATDSSFQISPPSLQLGMMQPGVPKSGKVTITNTGTEPIQIKKAVASCGCTTPNWPKEPIGPGESADIDITLKPTLKQGQKLSKRVTLTMMDGGAPMVIPVEGEVGLYVAMSPDFLDASNLESADQKMVVLESADETPFAIISVEPPVVDGMGADKSLRHELTMNWEKWEAGGRRPSLKFLTDHPNAPELSMTVRRAIVPSRPEMNTPPRVATSRLVAAAQANNLEGVKAAIAELDDLTSSSLGGMTAMHWASKNGNVEIIDVLLAAGADPNVGNKVGKRPAALAAENGQLEALQRIVAAGGEIDSRDEIGGTPLLWASALSKNPETVKFLIDSGADVNVIDSNGMTPLIWAAGIGRPETVRLLLDNGANTEVVEIHAKETALMRAARIGQPGTVDALVMAKPSLETKNLLGQTALIIACSSGSLDSIRALVDGGADLKAKDTRGWTVLDHARARTDPSRGDVIEFLNTVAPASVKEATPIVGG